MHCESKVRYFCCEFDLSFIPESGSKYSHTNSHNFAMTFFSQDDRLTIGAWAACEDVLKLFAYFRWTLFFFFNCARQSTTFCLLSAEVQKTNNSTKVPFRFPLFTIIAE